jgi:putative membrane protein
MSVIDLPLLNAILNSICTVFLLLGYYYIKQKNRAAHKRVMLAAVITSVLFLCSYLFYHYNVGSVRFTHQGIVRTLYFTVLFTHTILAASLVYFVPVTLIRGLHERFDKHKRLARWTFPIWLYVSITGVIVYLMLYQLYPPA